MPAGEFWIPLAISIAGPVTGCDRVGFKAFVNDEYENDESYRGRLPILSEHGMARLRRAMKYNKSTAQAARALQDEGMAARRYSENEGFKFGIGAAQASSVRYVFPIGLAKTALLAGTSLVSARGPSSAPVVLAALTHRARRHAPRLRRPGSL